MHEFSAAIFERPGQPMTVETVRTERPRAGEVMVRLRASGVCHSDYHVVLGEWASPAPIVLGHEGAGVVHALGDGVEGLAVGDHVILSWTPSCRRCRYCVTGRAQLCELAAATAYSSVSFDGTTRLSHAGRAVHSFLSVGSFGEYVVVPASGAIPIRRDMPFDKAALVGCAVTTGIGAAINTVSVRPGSSVLVIGCGGVGLSTIMGAALSSARPIIAVDRVPEKLELARRVGATEVLDGTALNVPETVREITGGGVEFAFEAIGLPATIELAYASLAPGGTAVVVGQTPDDSRISIDPFVMSDRELTLTGSNYGSAEPTVDFPRIADLHMAGAIDLDVLVGATIALDDLNEAFEAMAQGQLARSVVVYA